MRLIGLTGGIASGKTTVASMLEALGAQVINADRLYHALILPHDGQPSDLAALIEERFPGTLNDDNEIDRKQLGRIVFSDPEARTALETLTHPAVARAFRERVDALEQQGFEVAVYDVPLLYERGLDQAMDGIVVVWVPEEIQRARLCTRDSLSEEEIDGRLASQLPIDEKRRRATWVIDNTGSIEATRTQVAEIWRVIQQDAPEGSA